MPSDATEPAPPRPPDQPADDLGPLPGVARPFVDWVAKIRAPVHTKLLAGFLVIAFLLLSMGVVCIVVLNRVNGQVETLTALNRQTDQAREMIYEVTAQSHYRAMALLTGDETYTEKIYAAKGLFVQNLDELRTYAVPDRTAFFDELQAANDRFTLMSDQVTALDQAGKRAQAIAMHIDREHTQSHVLEDSLNALNADSQQLAVAETIDFATHRRFLLTSLIAGTALQNAPIVAVSSSTGAGLDQLREALDAELAKTAQRPDVGRPRLPVDRSFAMSGFGTVVTGTLVGGALQQGAELALLPAGRRVRIRGLQQHNRPVEEARPGSRTAVNLSGLDHSEVRRGDVLALPGTLPASRRLDARLVVLPGVQPLRHHQQLQMYHETSEVMIELSLLEGDELRAGEAGWVQLFAPQPVVALDGDRFILRVPSPAATVAGGVIVDSAPRRHRRRDPSVLADLAAREHADQATSAVLELGKHPWGLVETELASRLGVSPAQMEKVLAPLIDRGALRRLAARWLTREQWERSVSRVMSGLDAYHKAQPLRRGMPKEELRSRTGIPAELFAELLPVLGAEQTVVDQGGEVAAAAHHPALTSEQETAIGAFVAELEGQPFNPPPLPDLVRRYRLTPALLQYLVVDGRVVRVNDDTAFARTAYDDAVRRLRLHLSEHRTLTVAAARDVLGSSRRYVLPLLEWLDAQKITRRVGDDRILRS